MLGFRQDLGFAGSVQSVAAVSVEPEIEGARRIEGLDEAAIRSSETMHLGEAIEAEVGSTAVIGRLGGTTAEHGNRDACPMQTSRGTVAHRRCATGWRP